MGIQKCVFLSFFFIFLTKKESFPYFTNYFIPCHYPEMTPKHQWQCLVTVFQKYIIQLNLPFRRADGIRIG